MLKMNLFALLNPLAQSRLFAGLVVLSLILILILQVLDRPLQTEAPSWGIVSFELASDQAWALEILESLGASGRVHASLSLLAGVLDALENFALVQLLLDSEWYACLPMARWCALYKFGILLTVLIWLKIAWLQRLTYGPGAVQTRWET